MLTSHPQTLIVSDCQGFPTHTHFREMEIIMWDSIQDVGINTVRTGWGAIEVRDIKE